VIVRRRWWLLVGGLVLVISALIAARMSDSGPRPPGPCTDASVCFRATEQNDFPNYGNTYPSNLADCMFAAAANWQTIILGTTPREQQVETEYLAAAASSSSGVNEELFIRWWSTKGIGSVTAAGWTFVHQFDEEHVKTAVRQHRALFAIFTFHRHATVAGHRVAPGAHAAIIDGYTADGPLVVTWGHTYQMTWGEYWESINSIRAVVR